MVRHVIRRCLFSISVTFAGMLAMGTPAIALVEQLRGQTYAEALVLQGEYATDPSIKGGTLATTTPDVGHMMNDMFKPVAGQFRALAAT